MACDVGTSRGTCTQVTSGQPHGTRGACGGTGTCAAECNAASAMACTYPGAAVSCRMASCMGATLTRAAGCNGAGACAPVATTSCEDLTCDANAMACRTTCTSDAHCANAARPYCREGVCVAGRANGAPCLAAQECSSNRCVDGYCCNDACTAPCQACDVAGRLGSCSPVTGGTPHGGRPGCGGVPGCEGYCDGVLSGACSYPGPEKSCPCGLLGGTCNGAGQCWQVGEICL
jgi:hypothetical protein